MDGELDLRKVTVTHLLVHAMEPTEGRKVISVMWPGFVGTLSGVDELGNSIMINAGRYTSNYAPGPFPSGTPTEWIIVDVLRNMPAALFSQPSSAEAWILEQYKGVGGGVSPGGGIFFVLSNVVNNSLGWVYESDRFGGITRTERDVYPKLDNMVLASNHFHLYGAGHDPETGETITNFGQSPSFSSRLRYAAPAFKIMSWATSPSKTTIPNKQVTEPDIKELLQLVCNQETEHSIIWQPPTMTISIAPASITADPWNAPFMPWCSVPFVDFFQ